MKRLVGLVCVLGALACAQHERQIVLGPVPERPRMHHGDDDAGVEIPDGAMLCESDAQCDDAVSCTSDVCRSPGFCVHTPVHVRCSDDVFCNGVERCDPVQDCLPVEPPRCDDSDTCTVDRCDELEKACVHAPRDFDHDGEVDVHCSGGTDCDDFDETRGTRITEVCGNRIDDDCDETVDETECGRASHDKCDDALDVSKGGTFMLGLEGSVADYEFACDADASRDVVLTFTLKKAMDVKLAAHGVLADGSDEIASLVLQRSCGDLSTDIECRRGFPSDLRVRALPAGSYFVLASSYAARELLVSATFSAATPAPTNTTCAKAQDVSAGGRFSSDFVDVTDTASACGFAGGPDLYYAFTLTKTQDVELAANALEGAPIALRVQQGCAASAVPLLCDAQAPAQTRLHELAAGKYMVIVSGPASREVPFSLDVAVLPPTPRPIGDTCDQPLSLALGVKQQVTLADKQDDVDSSCQRFGADATLLLHVPNPMDVQLELDAGPALATLSLARSCGEPATELACRVGLPIQTRVRNLAAGDYFVVIEAPAAASATIKAVRLPATHAVAVSSNDVCQSAFVLPLEGGLFTGDTSKALDDYAAPCGGGAHSPDAVYQLVLTESKHVVATVDAEFDSVLQRIADDRTGADLCSDGQVAACDDDSGPGAQASLDEKLKPGTYYYVVDGFKTGNAGRYQLEITITDK